MKRRIVLAPLAAAILLLGAAPAMAQDKPDEPVSSEPVGSDPGAQPPDEGPPVFIDVLEYRGGDGDGVPEPGERLTVVIGLFNGSGEVLRNVSADLESLTDTVAVIKASSGYPDLQVRESAQGANTYEIDIAEGAERQPPCEDMPGEPMIIDDGDATTRDGDAPVSDDGQTLIAPAPGDTGTGGGSEPSYGEGEAQAEESTVTSTEEGTVVPEEEPVSEPQPIEPADGGSGSTEPGGSGGAEPGVIEPDGTEPDGTEPGVEPQQQDSPVSFKMILKVTASGQQYDLPIDNGAVCMYAMDSGVPAEGRPAGGDDLAAGAERNVVEDGLPVGSRSATPIAGVLLFAVAALLFRWAPSFGYRRAMQKSLG